MIRIALIAGSQRRGSLNAALLSHVAQRLAGRAIRDPILPGDHDLPLFDQDIEEDAVLVGRVDRLNARFARSDAIIVASPEYNGQLTPYLKNVVDWVSRSAHIRAGSVRPFQGQPVLLCSASTGGSGGALGIPSARALFGYVGCNVMADALCVPYADQALLGGAFFFDDEFEQRIDAAVAHLLDVAAATSAPWCASGAA